MRRGTACIAAGQVQALEAGTVPASRGRRGDTPTATIARLRCPPLTAMPHAPHSPPAPPALAPYTEAPRLARLRDWCDPAAFATLPGEWQVFVADVEQSTRAIGQGRLRQVNAIGAACIVAAARACGCDGIPYVFGGDGATVVVPPVFAPALARAWAGLQAQVAQALGLRLRVGRVPVAELREGGAELRVARHRLSAGFDVALFSGGGISLAERLVKGGDARWQVAPGEPATAPREALECRWIDVPSRHGRVLTLLARARGDDPSVLCEVMAHIEQAMPGAAPDHLRLDDVLRAVLDLTHEQAHRLQALLVRLHTAGLIDYGVHSSDQALITCFARSPEHHLHFIDGGGGGYYRAAAQLKASGAAGGK